MRVNGCRIQRIATLYRCELKDNPTACTFYRQGFKGNCAHLVINWAKDFPIARCGCTEARAETVKFWNRRIDQKEAINGVPALRPQTGSA